MKNYVLHIKIILLIYLGCVPPQNVLTPVDNSELRNFSDILIYAEISEENHKNVVFNGAYTGIQCYPEIEDFDSFLKKGTLINTKNLNAHVITTK